MHFGFFSFHWDHKLPLNSIKDETKPKQEYQSENNYNDSVLPGQNHNHITMRTDFYQAIQIEIIKVW